MRHAPSWFGPVGYEIVSDVEHGTIRATVQMPSRKAPREVLLRLRHPEGLPMKRVTVNGKPWSGFSAAEECVKLVGASGEVHVEALY